ncbi:MAG TPA: hypothetical protein VL331_13160 [Croceibacterium sp.]|nr:hypothetical protein [Croceibacterium sp.]
MLQDAGAANASEVIDARFDAKGKTSACKAVAMSGDAEVANSLCRNANGLEIKPACVVGEAAYGVVHNVIGGTQSGGAASEPADLELQVNKLPGGQPRLRVATNVIVGAAGTPQACLAVGDLPHASADVACTQVAGLTFGTIAFDSGKPARYVRSVIIDFELATAAPTGG